MAFYEHPEYKRIYGTKLVTPRIHFAWPCLIEPRQPPPLSEEDRAAGKKPGEPRYELTGVIYKDDHTADPFLEGLNTMVQAMVEQYNISAKKGRRPQIIVDDFLGDGDNWNAEKYPYYANAWLLIMRNAKLPVFKNAKGEKFFDASVFKGGDVGRCVITPHLGPTGISYKLEAAQLIKRGTVVMGGFASHGEMLAEEADGEDLVAAGAPAVVAPKKPTTSEIGDETEDEVDSSEEPFWNPEVLNKDKSLTAVVNGIPEKVNPDATKGVSAPAVKLTGKQLADQLKANAVAAAKGQVVSAPKPATVVTAPPMTKPVSKGKAAAVDML